MYASDHDDCLQMGAYNPDPDAPMVFWYDLVVPYVKAGFDDRGILQIIASWFNYINRVADGLGVGRSR